MAQWRVSGPPQQHGPSAMASQDKAVSCIGRSASRGQGSRHLDSGNVRIRCASPRRGVQVAGQAAAPRALPRLNAPRPPQAGDAQGTRHVHATPCRHLCLRVRERPGHARAGR
eukprot:gene20748-biopygen7070